MPKDYCDNGKDHAHVSKGSMKLAHNLDERADRARLSSTEAGNDEYAVLPSTMPLKVRAALVSAGWKPGKDYRPFLKKLGY